MLEAAPLIVVTGTVVMAGVKAKHPGVFYKSTKDRSSSMEVNSSS